MPPPTPAPGPTIAAHQAPMLQSPGWNQYRAQVIEAVTAVENLLRQAGRGVDSAGLTYEVAPLLGQRLDTAEDFEMLHRLVHAVRPVAREAIRRISREQGGQFSLALG